MSKVEKWKSEKGQRLLASLRGAPQGEPKENHTMWSSALMPFSVQRPRIVTKTRF